MDTGKWHFPWENSSKWGIVLVQGIKIDDFIKFLKKLQFFATKTIFFYPQTFFSRKSAYITFLEALQASLVKKISKILWTVFEKIEKTAIFGRKTAFFDPPKFFFENPAPSLFRNHNRLPSYQKSEKSNDRITRKVGNRRTNGRTNERTRANQ